MLPLAASATSSDGDPYWLSRLIERHAAMLSLVQLQALRRACAMLYAEDDFSPLSWRGQEWAARAIDSLDGLIAARQHASDKPNFI